MTINNLNSLRYDLKCCISYLTRNSIETQQCINYSKAIINKLKKHRKLKSISNVDYFYLKDSVNFYYDSYVRYILGFSCDYSIDSLRGDLILKFEREIGEICVKLKELEKSIHKLQSTIHWPALIGCGAIKSAKNSIKQYKDFKKQLAAVKVISEHNTKTLHCKSINKIPENLISDEFVVNMHNYEGITAKESGKVLANALNKMKNPPSLDQRLKEIQSKYKKIDKDHQRCVDYYKAITDCAYALCQVFGTKTKYDLTGTIRISKTY